MAQRAACRLLKARAGGQDLKQRTMDDQVIGDGINIESSTVLK
jgi:hypothetical protein